MAGKKGRSGRKREVSALMREAMEKVDQELPALFDALIEKAKSGDKEALIYLIDRKLGKPSTSTDLRIKGKLTLSPDDLRLSDVKDNPAQIEEWKALELGEG